MNVLLIILKAEKGEELVPFEGSCWWLVIPIPRIRHNDAFARQTAPNVVPTSQRSQQINARSQYHGIDVRISAKAAF